MRSTFVLIGLLLGSEAVFGGEKSYTSVLDSLSVSEARPDLCAQLKKAPVLYQNEKATYLNKLNFTIRGQYQLASISPAGANRFRQGSGGHDDEWRRFYFGGNAVMFNNRLVFNTLLNVGEIDGLHSTKDGRWARSRRDWSIYELYLQYNFDDFAVSAGKMAPNLTTDFSISSTEILTIERSHIANQLDSDSNWGVVVASPAKETLFSWNWGLMLNAAGTNLSDEIHFNTSDSAFTKATLSWDTSQALWGEKSSMTATYMHNFTKFDNRPAPADSFYAGPGARDVVACSWRTKQGDFYFLAEAAAGFNLTNRAEGNNVYGFYLLPSYRLGSHWEGVFRYQLSIGDKSVHVFNRYIPALTTYPSWVDSLNSFYFGVNYYLCGENPALFRIMLGAEYTTTHLSGRDDHGFSGWTYMAGVRFKF